MILPGRTPRIKSVQKQTTPPVEGSKEFNCDRRSALRELEPATRTGLAVLLTLNLAGVAGEEAGIAEGILERGVVAAERPGEPEANRAGLTHEPAAVHAGDDRELALGVGHLQGSRAVVAVPLLGEELIERAQLAV